MLDVYTYNWNELLIAIRCTMGINARYELLPSIINLQLHVSPKNLGTRRSETTWPNLAGLPFKRPIGTIVFCP